METLRAALRNWTADDLSGEPHFLINYENYLKARD
jgi:hypothetical protein